MGKNNISEQELDLLLKRSFLELDLEKEANQRMADAIAKQIFSPKPFATNLRVNLLRRLLFAGFSLGILIIAGVLVIISTENPEQRAPLVKSLLRKKIATTATLEPKVYPKDEAALEQNNKQANQEKPAFAPAEHEIGEAVLSSPDSIVPDSVDHMQTDVSKKKRGEYDGYIFPVLTEKEKKANEKEKKKMASAAAKLRRGEMLYSYIPGPADKQLPDFYMGNGFYMGSGEVTNLEYRTFLFDLLINGQKEDFLAVKPEQNLWVNAGGVHFFDTLSRIYFSDKKYNMYPVVNIPLAGAEMYCKWLSQQANELRQRENKPALEIRLPYEKEWQHAASSGLGEMYLYPWPSDSVQNRSNCFMGNFCIQKQKDKFRYPIYYGKHKIDPGCYTTAGMFSRNPGLATSYVCDYNPNAFGLYCVSGNVSEMVYTNDGKGFKTKGGNWNSDFNHLRLDSEDEFEGKLFPSPMIGFRICAFVKQ